MKLDNKGWGLGVFLIFLVMFFLVLLLIANLINNYNERFICCESNNHIGIYLK